MRPPSSSYDRAATAATAAARPILDRLHLGETVSYEDVDAMIDEGGDMAWHEHIRDLVEEVPGDGYRLLREPPSPDDLRAWRDAEGLTQERAAKLAGVELRAWQRWESGERAVPQWLADTLRQRWGSAP